MATYKVVEINNVVGLRTGHIIAQTPLNKAGYYDASAEMVENGAILFLIGDELVTADNVPAGLAGKLQPILHYTEELFTDGDIRLNRFAVPFVGDVAYPRGIVLNIGDVFTTNNYTGTLGTANYATIDANGELALVAALPTGYSGPLFAIEVTTLPDGITMAGEFTYLGLVTLA